MKRKHKVWVAANRDGGISFWDGEDDKPVYNGQIYAYRTRGFATLLSEDPQNTFGIKVDNLDIKPRECKLMELELGLK